MNGTLKRRGRGMMAALLALILVFTLVCLALEAEHDCQGECCPVCALLRACIRLTGAALLLWAAFAMPTAELLFPAARTGGRSRSALTPVSMKVKLSD